MQNQIPTQQESSGNETLEFTNGAFLGEGFQIKHAFWDTVMEEFVATVDNVEFSDPTSAAEEINSWVANHTHDKIQNLVSPGKEISLIIRKVLICERMNAIWLKEVIVSDSLDSTTRLVLVNAIYYKNLWKTAFQKENTRNEVFCVDRNAKKEVPTMHLHTKLLTGYNENLKSRWLQLPFEVCTTLQQVVCNIIYYQSSKELLSQILVTMFDKLLMKHNMTFHS